LRPFAIDWADDTTSRASVVDALREPAALGLVWYHQSWRGLPLEVARDMSDAAAGVFDFFLVLGSAASDPSRPDLLDQIRATFGEIAGCRLHLILLGFVVEDGGSRWLTNDEISAGAIAAMTSNSPETTIGVTRPWDARP